VLDPDERPVHPLLVAEALRFEQKRVEARILLLVGIEHPVAERRRPILGPVVADRSERLPGRAVAPAADVAKYVHEPAVVEAVMRGEAGDGVDPPLVDRLGVAEAERRSQTDLRSAVGV